MDFILITFAIVLAFAGIAGALLPGIPGPPLSYLALFLLGLTDKTDLSSLFFIVMGIIAIVVFIIDIYIPVLGTKISGGTKAGARGSLIGLIIAVLILPFIGIVIGPFGLIGIILGPFIGALVGEKIAGTPDTIAMKAAIGSFLGFLAGTLMKFVYSIAILVIIVIQIFKMAI